MKKEDIRQLLSVPVIVAALGYFVDIYDLLLFGIVRKPSLIGLGIPDGEQVTNLGNIFYRFKWEVCWSGGSSGYSR